MMPVKFKISEMFDNSCELFENEMMVSALIDRVTFRSHICNIKILKVRSE